MGCLFGYYGKPAAGLLESMASLLTHRCKRGWERSSRTFRDGRAVEIGHGIAPWTRPGACRVISDDAAGTAFGYSGVLFGSARSGVPAAEDASTMSRLLARLRQDPERGLEALDGAFVAALATADALHLVRDPAGIKVIYWTVHQDRIVFASEIKALFADPGVDRKMRIAALPEYLTFSYIPGSGTMFEGIEELQPGHILKFANGRVEIRRYFQFEELEWNTDGRNGTDDHAARLREVLEAEVETCCEAVERPPAVFVSGGIDSSAVLALAARRFPDVRLKTFSVHFGEGYVNENQYVSLMVERYRTDHTWLEIRPAMFLERMQEIFWYLDDPIGDPITIPNFLMAEAASRVTGLVLNGEGGDPCFGGPKNIPMMLARIYGPSSAAGNGSWLEREYLLSYRKCFADLEKILDPMVFRQSGGEDALIAHMEPFFRTQSPSSFLNKLMATNIRLKGANLILVKVDKMTSANGVLALPPLFTRRVIEESMACPPGLKLEGNCEKSVLKRAVADIVPQPIIDRPKSGMMVPVRFWFRNEMYRYAKRLLSGKNLKRLGFFNTEYVHRLLNYEITDTAGLRYGTKLWMLIMFVVWHELMIESRVSKAPREWETRAPSGWTRCFR